MPSREKRAQRRAECYGYQGEHFSLGEWERLVEACGNRCLGCGASGELTVDHITPLSLGGSNRISNIQPLCETCNNLKGTVILDLRPGSIL